MFCSSFGRGGIRAFDGSLHERHETEYRRLRRPAHPHFRFPDEHERFPVNAAIRRVVSADAEMLINAKQLSKRANDVSVMTQAPPHDAY